MALLLGGAAATVVVGVATNQVLSGGRFDPRWLYVALGAAVPAAVFQHLSSRAHERKSGRGSRAGWLVYTRQLRASVSNMEILGVVTQGEFVLGMSQVYVDVALRPRPPQDTIGDVAPGPSMNRRPLRSFLAHGRVLAVIGSPGSGKTTLVRHTALTMCQRRRWLVWRDLPVLVYLRDHVAMILDSDNPADLAEVAVSAGWLDGRVAATWLRRRLEAGRCVVLLDGLDEVADEHDRKRAVTWAQRQVARYPANAFVVTSRPLGYLSNPVPNADVLQVQRFTTGQISSFVQHWYLAIESRARGKSKADTRRIASRAADELLLKLRDRPALYDLAANPLLLTMIANVHRYKGALPGSRAALYAEMCGVLLYRRLEAKNLVDPTGLTGLKKERVVQELALHMMTHQQRNIGAHDAAAVVRRVLLRVSRPPAVSPDVFLKQMCAHGLIIEREHGIYSFTHMTFQEYLAAAQIREVPSDYLHLLTGNVNDVWWREATLLWAAASNATPVIEACLESGTFRALTLAFGCAEEAREADSEVIERLDELLGSAAQADDERRRLIAAVTAQRNFRDVIWLDETDALCAQPVSHDLYGLFLQEPRAAGPYSDRPRTSVISGSAVGMLGVDAQRFVGWLNTVFDDAAPFRLPTVAEITHPNAVFISKHLTYWTTDGQTVVLHVPAEASPPYVLNPRTLADWSANMVRHIGPVLRLVNLNRSQAEGETQALVYANTYADALVGDSPRAPEVELIIALDQAHRTVGMLAAGAGEAGQALLEALTRARDLAGLVDRALALDIELNSERAAKAMNAAARPDAMPQVADDLAAAVDISIVTALEHAPALDAAFWLLDLLQGLDVGEGWDALLDLAPTRDHPSLAPNLNRALVLGREVAQRLGRRYRELLPVTASALGALTDVWMSAPASRRVEFEVFLREFQQEPRFGHWEPDLDPVAAISQVLDRLAVLHLPVAERLVEQARSIIQPILERNAPWDSHCVRTAQLALVAAVVVLRQTSEHHMAARLAGAVSTLIALDDDQRNPTEAMLLVR